MYKEMNKFLNDCCVGDFRIENFEIKSDDMYAIFHRIPSGKFVRLIHKGSVVMSDTNMEKRTNANFVYKAHGNVLIGGLGIGMILLAIQDKPEVETILVLEKHKEVIELVKEQLPLNEKVKIVNADVFEYLPNQRFNTIYMDIWNYINKDVYEESMKPLIRKYRKYLVQKDEDENRYIDCWCRNEAKRGIRI